jgi:hypothetical protein
MESNIRQSLSRGELLPTIPRAKMEKEGPPQEPLPARVRTISGMNEQLLAELRDDNENTNRSPRGAPVEGRPPLPQRRAVQSSKDEPLKHNAAFHADTREDTPEVFMEKDGSKSPVDEDLQGEFLLDEPLLDDGAAQDLHMNNSSDSMSNGNSSMIARPPALTIHKRRNTSGTVFVKSTMENPDIQATIKCVCGVYRAHLVESQSNRAHLPSHLCHMNLDIFRDDFARQKPVRSAAVPKLSEIVSFYEKFFQNSQMEQDTIIMSLIYVERLIKETNGALTPTPDTWASVLFSCMILASKVWDDLSMWNVDFSNVSLSSGMCPFSLKRINQLELAVLTCLNFNVKVPASEYAKYYFLIRTMLTRCGLLESCSSASLNKEEANKLEIRTSQYQDNNFQNRNDRNRARSCDMDFVASPTAVVGPVLEDRACLKQLVSMDQ